MADGIRHVRHGDDTEFLPETADFIGFAVDHWGIFISGQPDMVVPVGPSGFVKAMLCGQCNSKGSCYSTLACRHCMQWSVQLQDAVAL